MRILSKHATATRYGVPDTDQPLPPTCTTAEVAAMFDTTTRWILRLVADGDLPAERTRSGQHFFRRDAVNRTLIKRREDAARSEAQRHRDARRRHLDPAREPEQLALFSRLRLVARSERQVPTPEPKRARSFPVSTGSDREDSVNRKAAGQ
ncbi:MAG TPA: helix-turn-helix domain-containing protein [Vicinamibacterales bacterium]|nr:helix-turn-helix domain-containing protein [Vicinamibacterales bacterium]